MANHSRILLDGTWDFQIEGESDVSKRTITVPLPWEVEFPELRDRPVTATYSRKVKVPATWKSGIFRLCFGAVDYYSEVSVNGFLVGTHEGGYTPFQFEIQEFLRAGEENTITIKVMDGAPSRMVTGAGALTPEKAALDAARPFPFTEIPHGKQSWYGTIGGIWQSVFIERRSDCYIDNVFVRPDLPHQGASVRVRISHPPLDATGYSLHFRLDSPKGVAAVAPTEAPLPGARQVLVNCALRIPNPALWDMDNPNLYGLTIELRMNGKVIDSYETRFGMRSIEAKEGNILLNGKTVFLAGALDQDFYPGTLYTPPSTAYLRDQFVKAKEMGLNLLRCHIKTPDPRYLDLCDEMGIMVWYEIPNWAVLTKKSGKRGREHLEAMLERDYNHASLLILSVMNESWGIDLSQKWQRDWLVEMFDYAKSLDPTRLVVDNSACEGNYHVKSDLDDYHVYFSIPDHAGKWAAWCKDFASRPVWTYTRSGDAQRTKKEPVVLSEFGNWGLPKVSLLRKGYGGSDPWWFLTGAGSARPEGVVDRFRRYGLNKIFGTYDKMAEISQEQQWISLKYEIEEMRKHSTIVGYVITEFTDLNWESNGLLDMCRNPKVYYDRLAPLQGQDLIIPDHKRTAYWGGERFMLSLLLSHFGQRDLTNAVVEWEISGLSTTPESLSGQFTIATKPAIGTSVIDTIVFRVPDLERAQDVQLNLRLSDAKGNEINRNSEKFVFFPASSRRIGLETPVYIHDPNKILPNARAVLNEADVPLVDRLVPGVLCIAGAVDETLLHFIDRGGSVLLFALERESLPRTTSGLASVDRDKNGWWGDWCSGLNWFHPNGPWEGIPQTQQFDFTFRNIVPKRVLLGWNPEVDSDDILSGLFLGWIGFPATLLGGFRYGKGKVLATTFDLFAHAKTDPVSVAMLGDLLRYTESKRFAPKKMVEMTRIELSHTLIPTAEERGALWHYTTAAPEGDWKSTEFDDSGWKTGRSGFGRGLSQVTSRTNWSQADIWLRLRIEVPAEGIRQASLRYFHDDDFEIYVNGEPLFTREGYTVDYEDLVLAPDQVALFIPGKNIISIHCQNHSGPQYVDIGITYEINKAVPSASTPRNTPPSNPVSDSSEVAHRREKAMQTTKS